MTAEPLAGRFYLAPVEDGRPAWAAAEVVIATPVVELGDVPSIAVLFTQLVTAPGAPDFDGVHTAAMDRDKRGVVLTVDSRAAFLAWTGFLALPQREEVLERTAGRLSLLRTGRVTVAGIRVRVVVRWRLELTEVGA